MIQATIKQFHEISNYWTIVFKTATTQTILDLGEAVQNFYQRSSVLKYQNGIAPLHVAAATGNLWLFREIYAKALDRYPRDNKGWTILYFPAQNGHLHVYEYISNKCYDQNPRDNTGWTPLHSAAAKDYVDVCETIMSKIQNQVPYDDEGRTPIHLAANKGNLRVCHFFMIVIQHPSLLIDLKLKGHLHRSKLKGDAMNLTLRYDNVTSFPSWILPMQSWFYVQDRYLSCHVVVFIHRKPLTPKKCMVIAKSLTETQHVVLSTFVF